MKFFLDHDVPTEIARILSGSGHDIFTVSQVLAATATDDEVFEATIDADQIPVTCNRDNLLVLAKERERPRLVVLIRQRTQVAEGAALLRLIDRAGPEGLQGNINFA